MNTGSRHLRFALAASCAAAFFVPLAGQAQNSAAIAKVVSVQGTVESQRTGDPQWQRVKLNDTYAAGDKIRVAPRSRADIALLDRSVLRLNENSSVTIEPIKGQRTGVIDLLRGAVHFLSRGPESLVVNTPFTVAGVRGTEFLVEVEPERTLLSTFEGTVVAENEQGRVVVTAGQSAVAEKGKAPVLRMVAHPRDAVQWALYYPPVLNFRADDFPAGADWKGLMRQSIEAYERGDIAAGFATIVDVPPADVKDQRFFTYRAHLLMTVGRVTEAAADIDRALAIAANDPDALALQTLAAIVQNDAPRALGIARTAVQAAPKSAAALIALSYAQQASFDLNGARASLEKAVQLEPENALAWARLAELYSSQGDLVRSRIAAQKAAVLKPGLARTQTVLGYAHLSQGKIPAATAAFEAAIALDSADPLPRLGLGLVKIRAGRLNDGARDIEVAASLDPGNAVVRSYLGKAYYEEKRSPLDEREYATASEVDPKDPTPWFYGAIAKQTANRPVEALQDLEKAMELNDNRAVYRSRLLLDADLAARSASLARVYSDLGFQQLALVEGWKSVNTDPTSFSAHRFLADSYSVLPRHEIARVSELLQAQLLQPLNLTPIQPQLGESNLYLISSSGPGALSFNEFNPIFNRDRLALQMSGLGGEQGNYVGDAVAAGVYRNASVSAGYAHFQTDGFRPNADQKDNIANAFVQLELAPSTSVQAEYRYRDRREGDLTQVFDPDNYSRNTREEVENQTFRLGARHALGPESIFLGSFMYQTAQDDVTNVDELFGPGSSFSVETPQHAAGGELEHLFRSRYFNLRTGAGYFDISSKIHSILAMPPMLPDDSTTDTHTKHGNIYAYADVRPLPRVSVTVGAEYDSLTGDQKRDQLNPKVGFVWNPFAATTFRAAAFRVLKRTLITNQTIEPTEVAGFNQFFDDASLTDSWRYGAAIDQKIGASLFAGVELSRRDLSVPYQFVDMSDPMAAPVDKRASWKEDLGRVYLFWTPRSKLVSSALSGGSLALSAEYSFERTNRDEAFAVGLIKLDTQRVPLTVRVFHPSGLSAAVTATFYQQEGTFESLTMPTGSDQFVLLDAGLSYRLPKRHGFLTVGVMNLLDDHFKWYELDLNNPQIQPVRRVFAKVTVPLP